MHIVNKSLAASFIALATLAGCASQPSATTNSNTVNSTPLNEFLNNAASHSATQLATSPWGANVQVTTGATYFAASGKTCRPLQIIQPAGSQLEQIACKAKNGQWQLSRSLREQ
ncbi:DVU3141 family protein [Oceanimonas sp. CHS3-5]|uniref:DVU3141 family protein n=1 Tax=Oceanimonas sp. CHS3-5 TaxID=3068186 RepID=UPI00273FC6F2|nr:DVU3141 family protein [Oceanimonas sp. CHS3-5]MDP5292280.1 DVU3141 family protein [Oceanimonas sp. CHS3-5]